MQVTKRQLYIVGHAKAVPDVLQDAVAFGFTQHGNWGGRFRGLGCRAEGNLAVCAHNIDQCKSENCCQEPCIIVFSAQVVSALPENGFAPQPSSNSIENTSHKSNLIFPGITIPC